MYRPDPLRVLSPAVVSALSNALQLHLSGAAPCEELTTALRALATEAGVAELPEEHVLILLGTIWDSLPAVRLTSDAARREQVRREIVWQCIDTYYERPAPIPG